MKCMRRAIFCAAVLVLLYPLAANAGGDAAIPDAPSSLLPANAAIKVTPIPSSVQASPLSPEHSGVMDQAILDSFRDLNRHNFRRLLHNNVDW